MKVEERVAHPPGKWKVDTKHTNRYGGFSITADGSRPNSLRNVGNNSPADMT